MRLYLAHPTLDRKEVRRMESELEKKLGIELVNPFYDVPERDDIDLIDSGLKSLFYQGINYKEIVERDLKTIDSCDGLLGIITEKLSVGTSMEIFYNSKTLGRPTYLIVKNEALKEHPWLLYFATKIFGSEGEFSSYVDSCFRNKDK